MNFSWSRYPTNAKIIHVADLYNLDHLKYYNIQDK